LTVERNVRVIRVFQFLKRTYASYAHFIYLGYSYGSNYAHCTGTLSAQHIPCVCQVSVLGSYWYLFINIVQASD